MKLASVHLLCQATSLFGPGVSWNPRRTGVAWLFPDPLKVQSVFGASLHSSASIFLPAQCSVGISPQNPVHSLPLAPGLCPGSTFLPRTRGSIAGPTRQGLDLIGPS